MSDTTFAGFTEEEQERYAAEAEVLYGESVRESNRKWKAYPASKKDAIKAEGKAVYTDMIAAMPKGAASAEVQSIVERWRKHMEYFWTPNLDQLLALANGYNDDPRFKANFDKMHSATCRVHARSSEHLRGKSKEVREQSGLHDRSGSESECK